MTDARVFYAVHKRRLEDLHSYAHDYVVKLSICANILENHDKYVL